MIHELGDAEGRDRTFVIMPNRSMTWRGVVWAYSAIAGVTLLIAIGCYVMGLTLVLPFSGIELLIVGTVFYNMARQWDKREVVIVGEDFVAVQTGRHEPETQHEFPRHWASIVHEHNNSWYPSRLLIRSHGRQVEIGRFLNEQERSGLAEMLSAEIRSAEYRMNSVTPVTDPS